MTYKYKNRLRTHRKHWKLSEADLAKLLGAGTPSTVCRIEKGSRHPRTKVLIACEFLFGAPAATLFPALYHSTQEAVLQRAARLSIQLEGKTDRASKRKRELLATLVKRAPTNAKGA